MPPSVSRAPRAPSLTAARTLRHRPTGGRARSATFCAISLPTSRCPWSTADRRRTPRHRRAAPRTFPALGATREHQQRGSAWPRPGGASMRRSADCSACGPMRCAKRRDLHGAARAASAERSQRRRSLHTLYDTWIDCAEDAYARMAHGEAFCSALADYVNASSQWRRELQASIEYSAKLLDLPTRSEINALTQRLRALEKRAAAQHRSRAPRRRNTRRKAAEQPRAARAPQGKAMTPRACTARSRRRAIAPPAARRGRRCGNRERCTLYRYRPIARPAGSVPLLIVYALVNRPYMMDLQEDRSLIRGLLAAGGGCVPHRLGLSRRRGSVHHAGRLHRRSSRRLRRADPAGAPAGCSQYARRLSGRRVEPVLCRAASASACEISSPW